MGKKEDMKAKGEEGMNSSRQPRREIPCMSLQRMNVTELSCKSSNKYHLSQHFQGRCV